MSNILIVIFLFSIIYQLKFNILLGPTTAILSTVYLINKGIIKNGKFRIKRKANNVINVWWMLILYGTIITLYNYSTSNITSLVYPIFYGINYFIICAAFLQYIVTTNNLEYFYLQIRNIGWLLFIGGFVERITHTNITLSLISESYYLQYVNQQERIMSIFQHPIGYAIVLECIFIITLFHGYKDIRVNAIYFVLLISNIVMTKTRTVLISVILILIILLLLKLKDILQKGVIYRHKNNFSHIIKIFPLFLFSVFIIYFNIDNLKEMWRIFILRLSQGFSGYDQGIRLGIIDNFIKYFKSSNPFRLIFGNGMNYSNSVFMMKHGILHADGVWTSTTDNTYISIILDYGLVGLILFFIPLLYAVYILFNSMYKKENKIFSMNAMILIALYIDLFFLEGLYWTYIFVLYFLSLIVIGRFRKNGNILL